MARDEGKMGGDGKTSPLGNGMGAPQHPMSGKPRDPCDDGLPSGGQGKSGTSGYDPSSVPGGGPIYKADPTTPQTKPDGGVKPAQMPFKVSK